MLCTRACALDACSNTCAAARAQVAAHRASVARPPGWRSVSGPCRVRASRTKRASVRESGRLRTQPEAGWFAPSEARHRPRDRQRTSTARESWKGLWRESQRERETVRRKRNREGEPAFGSVARSRSLRLSRGVGPTVVDRCSKKAATDSAPIEVAPPRTRSPFAAVGGASFRDLGRVRETAACRLSSLRLIRLGPWRPVLKHGPRSLTHARAKRTNEKPRCEAKASKREAALRRRGRAGSKVGSRTDRSSERRQSAALTEVHLQGPERWWTTLGQAEAGRKSGGRPPRFWRANRSSDLSVGAKDQSNLLIAGSRRSFPQDSRRGSSKSCLVKRTIRGWALWPGQKPIDRGRKVLDLFSNFQLASGGEGAANDETLRKSWTAERFREAGKRPPADYDSASAEWATLGKQDWRCGMNRTRRQGARRDAHQSPQKVSIDRDSRSVAMEVGTR